MSWPVDGLISLAPVLGCSKLGSLPPAPPCWPPLGNSEISLFISPLLVISSTRSCRAASSEAGISSLVCSEFAFRACSRSSRIFLNLPFNFLAAQGNIFSPIAWTLISKPSSSIVFDIPAWILSDILDSSPPANIPAFSINKSLALEIWSMLPSICCCATEPTLFL